MKYLLLSLISCCFCYGQEDRFPEHRFSFELSNRVAWETVQRVDNEEPRMSLRAFRAKDDSCVVTLLVGDNATGVSDLAEYVRGWAKGVTNSGGKILKKAEAKLDDIPAVACTTEIVAEGRRVTQLSYIALYDGKLCVLGLISEQADPSEVIVLKEVLASVRIKE
jgi:hypothetical protein